MNFESKQIEFRCWITLQPVFYVFRSRKRENLAKVNLHDCHDFQVIARKLPLSRVKTFLQGIKKWINLGEMCGRKKVFAADQVEKVPEVVVKTRVSHISKSSQAPIAPDTCCVNLRFEIPKDLMDKQIQVYRNIEEKLLYYGMMSEDGRKDLQTVQEEIVIGLYTLFLNRDPLRIPLQYEGAVTIVKK